MKSVGRNDILAIKPGKVCIFRFQDAGKINSVKTCVSLINKKSCPHDVKCFVTKAFPEELMIAVAAIQKA